MSKIIIYPNNTVDIDNVNTAWTANDFAIHGIDIVRNGINHPLDKECEKFTRNGNQYIVFFAMHRNSQLTRIKRRRINNPFQSQIIKRR